MANPASYDGWLSWLVTFNEPGPLWEAQPSYLISQAVYMLAGLLTLAHALHVGGRWPYFWLGTVLHGLFADNFWHFVVPEYDNFWHSQTPVMLLGGRTPLHILVLYPAFMYHAAYAVSRLQLPRFSEPCAVGLLTVLIDIPYDIVAVKFVHWTWHDTDPNIYDRHYFVPWNSYYFHATFTASFYYFFHKLRKAPNVEQWGSAGLSSELLAMILASLLGMPFGVLMFLPIYHPLHDNFNIHSEVTFFMLAAIFGAVVLAGLMIKGNMRTNLIKKEEYQPLSYMELAMVCQLALHYLLYLLLVVFGDPSKERSTGLHEPVGPCDEMASLVTPFGQKLFKRQYLCLNDYDEKYFDFKCTDERPSQGDKWYTICGTPFENRAEYITVLSAIAVLAAGVFYTIYFVVHPVHPPTKPASSIIKNKRKSKKQ